MTLFELFAGLVTAGVWINIAWHVLALVICLPVIIRDELRVRRMLRERNCGGAD